MVKFFVVTGFALVLANGWIAWWLWRALDHTGWLRPALCLTVAVLGASFPLLYKLGGDSAIEEAGDGGVLERGEDLALGHEAAACVVGIEAAAEQFDSGGHGELAVGAFGDPDGAHAAGGEGFQ